MSFPLPDGDPCYFCELVASGKTAWNVLQRNEMTMTVLNGRQYEVGQCIVFPIRHAPTLIDLREAEGTAVMNAAKRLTQVMVNEFGPDGVLLYQNNGTGSGQEVPHFHLHVVPRRKDSDWGMGPPHIARLERREHPPQLDHSVMTDKKQRTVDDLRRHL